MEYAEQMLDLLIQSYDEEVPLCKKMDAEMIERLSNDNSEEIRAWLARALAYHNSDTQAIALLCKLSQDTDSSVRVEAVDSLSGFATQDSFDMLCQASEDEDELVRAYAAFGIAYIGRKLYPERAMQTLMNMAQTEKSERVFVDIFEGLYILGKNEMLEKLIELYHSTDYQVQCATLNVLDELVYPQNVSTIYKFVSIQDTSACVPAVACALDRLAQRCQAILDEQPN